MSRHRDYTNAPPIDRIAWVAANRLQTVERRLTEEDTRPYIVEAYNEGSKVLRSKEDIDEIVQYADQRMLELAEIVEASSHETEESLRNLCKFAISELFILKNIIRLIREKKKGGTEEGQG